MASRLFDIEMTITRKVRVRVFDAQLFKNETAEDVAREFAIENENVVHFTEEAEIDSIREAVLAKVHSE